jgi:hypothetical protein
VIKTNCPCNRPWRPIRLWDDKDPTLSRPAMTNLRSVDRIRPAAWFTPAPAKTQVYFQKS